MSKIVFIDLPMKKELTAFNYKAEGDSRLQYGGKVIFPVNSVLASTLRKTDKVKVVFLSKQAAEDHSTNNELAFKQELEEINSAIGAQIVYKNISTPFIETRDIHESLLRSLVDELEEGAEIISDITYGPKSLPIILFNVLTFAEKNYNCTIDYIVYGKVDFVDDGTGTGHTVPANPVLYNFASLFYLNSLIGTIDCGSPEKAVKALDLILNM